MRAETLVSINALILCEPEVGFDTDSHFEHPTISRQRDRITSTITAQSIRHADCQKSEQQKHCSNSNYLTFVSTAQHCTKTPCSLQWIKRLTLLFAPRHDMQSKPMYRRAGDPEVAPPGRRPGQTFQDQIMRVARGGGGASRTARRGTTPRPSQSTTLKLFARATGSTAVDVQHSTTEEGDAPERVVILSQGVRYLRQNPGHGLSIPDSPVYLHDLRSCRNPQHDVSHRGHVGYYPGIWSQLGNLPSFRSELLNALRECSNERCCTIAFQCTAGRHRSVAAAMLLERLIWVRFPLCNVEVQHLHEDRWAESTCCASCNSCWITRNRAPNEQLRVLIQNLLEEFDREAYMCAALQRVSPERCSYINASTRLNIDGHVSSDHTDCESHKACCPNLQKLYGGMEGYVDWQLFQAISPISVHHEDDISPFHERGSASGHSSPHDWIGAQHYSPPFSEPSARSSFAKTIADTIIDTESSGFTLTQTWTQRSTQQKPQQKRKRECSSGDSDGFYSIEQKHYMEQNLWHQIQNSQHSPTRSDSMQRSHNCQTASVATNEVPRSCYSPPRSLDLRCSRTRDSDEWANSLFDFFDNQQHPTLQWNSQDVSSLYFQRSNESEASSILRFLQMQGPYPGWEYDEFLGEGFDPTPPPSARDDIVLPIICSGNSTTSQSSSDRAAPSADSWYSQMDVLHHAGESPFWNNRSIDSDGILRDSIDRNHRFVDEALPSLTPESQQVPTPLRWRWYRSPIAGDEDDEDTQTSRRTLESIFDEVHGENAYITISPIRRRTTSDSLQGEVMMTSNLPKQTSANWCKN